MIDIVDPIPVPAPDWSSFGAYKRVDCKVKPVPGVFPEDVRVTRIHSHAEAHQGAPL
ncbi:hypothetical protein SERLA73DRAFT_80752 [Serpula lacrymans var. lacrymans S7.3]|uniref:Uncharacterized protein n=1 Tax=Serpula lacrymans var. lacrymans (strain S7.3) TaxID=936435 RepID=F8QK79_SERL3|nr:hypothetical protein SERLA73DRAFT_80752 [Serpula lacrymans var. lacrymans S7.3]